MVLAIPWYQSRRFDRFREGQRAFEKKRNWKPFAIVDGRLITGQNPGSSTTTAQTLLQYVARAAAAWPSPRRNNPSVSSMTRLDLAGVLAASFCRRFRTRFLSGQ